MTFDTISFHLRRLRICYIYENDLYHFPLLYIGVARLGFDYAP